MINIRHVKFINKLSNHLYFYFSIFLLLGICNIIFDLIEPKLANYLIDTSLSNSYNNSFLIISLLWLLVYLTRTIFSYVYKRLTLRYKLNTFNNLRKKLFERLLKYPISYFQSNANGYILSRQVDDIESIEGILLYNIINFSLSLLELIIILFFMIRISFILTIISILLMIANICLNFIFPIKLRYKEHNNEKANVLQKLQDAITGIKVIKSMNAQEYEFNRFNNVLKNYYKVRRTRDIMDINRRDLSSFLNGISYPLTIIIGGFFVYKNILTVGSIMAFTIYFSKLTSLLNPIISFIPLFKIGEASMDRINENLTLNTENSNINTNLKIKNGKIEFKDVKLCYEDNRNILDSINITITPGSKIAIVGPSGSGKSSIANLLFKFYSCTDGQILIDDLNINDYSIEELRNSTALIQQESFLFNRTLNENLQYNKGHINDKLYEAINSTFSSTIVSNLEFGLDTLIKDRGNNLSGGEKQRLCITREILKQPKILILDEVTSALDTISEEVIQKSIDNLSLDKTVIIITHKLSTIKKVDYIFVLYNGKFVEHGNHNELISKKGLYYSLLNNSKNNEI